MKELNEAHTPAKTARKLGVLSARTHAHPETRAHSPSLLALRALVLAKLEAHELAIIERMAATALLHYQDGVVGVSMQKLSRDVLQVLDGNREHDLYKAGFPIAPSVSTANVADDIQHHYVQVAIATFGAWAEAPAHIREQVAKLAADQAELVAAQAAQAAAYLKEAQAWSELQLTTAKGQDAYNHLYHHLRDRLPHLKKLVESLFA